MAGSPARESVMSCDSLASSVFDRDEESLFHSTKRTLSEAKVSVVDLAIVVVLLGLCLLGQYSATPITFAGWATLFMIGVAVLLMARHGAPPDVTLLACTGLLRCSGVISSAEAWQGFGSPDIISIGVLFAVAKGLQEAGTMELVLRAALGSPESVPVAVCRVMLPLIVLSAFMNDIFCVIVLIPVVEAWAARINIPARRLMLPVAFGALLGGMCTLLGTSTNLVLNDLIKKDAKTTPTSDASHIKPLQLFSFTAVAAPVALLGTAYMAFAMRYLLPPAPEDPIGAPKAPPAAEDEDGDRPSEDRELVREPQPDWPYAVTLEVDAVAGGGVVGAPLRQTSLARTMGAAIVGARWASGGRDSRASAATRRKSSLRRSGSFASTGGLDPLLLGAGRSGSFRSEDLEDVDVGGGDAVDVDRPLAVGDTLLVACNADGLAALRRVRGVRLEPSTGDAAKLRLATPGRRHR